MTRRMPSLRDHVRQVGRTAQRRHRQVPAGRAVVEQALGPQADSGCSRISSAM